jgi:alcohol dehydrogenase
VTTIRALKLVADRKLELADVPTPPPPAAGEVQIAVKAVALNHIDLWGFRGMAFAKRNLPLVVGAEAAGEVAAVGAGVKGFQIGDPVVMYGALTCGACKACREGRDNLCENVAGIMGFHVDGFARERVNLAARLVIPVPDGISLRDAACAPIAFSTVQHMLFDNASSSPARRSWFRPVDRASAPRRSRWPRRSAAPSSPRSATTRKSKRPRHSAPTTSSTTAPTGSRRSCAS